MEQQIATKTEIGTETVYIVKIIWHTSTYGYMEQWKYSALCSAGDNYTLARTIDKTVENFKAWWTVNHSEEIPTFTIRVDTEKYIIGSTIYAT